MTDDEVNNPRALAGILARAAARRRDDGGLPPDREPIADLCKPLSAKVMPRSAMVNHRGELRGEDIAILKQRREKEGHGIKHNRRATPLRDLHKHKKD